ncbi:cobalamin biosynthesis protein [Chloroflexota bacterium]
MTDMEMLITLILALVLDLAIGEPPNTIHLVAWIGKLVSLLKKKYKNLSRIGQLVYGTGIVLLTMAVFTMPVYFLLFYLKSYNSAIYVIVGAVILKFTFSARGLWQVALKAKKFLIEDKLDDTRVEMNALVSRDTRDLSKASLISAIVESVAENTSDSIVAPLFYFLLFGIPGAIAYRVVNTLDAMIGYHGEYEYLGKFACRLDDVLNYIPARLTTLLLILSALSLRRNGGQSWQVALREHSKTESPNAGWPMSAMAGALNVQLEKHGHYQLGRANTKLVPQTIDNSLMLAQIAMLMWVLICLTTGGIQIVTQA